MALWRDKEPWTDLKAAHHSLSLRAKSYISQHVTASINPALETEDLACYMTHLNLVDTRLFQFDDRPENYRAWQSSFNNAVRGLALTNSKELDLLTMWLGRESTEHVKRIRPVHVSNSAAALKKAWERLQDS